jgi:hypothetical protein
MISRVRSNSRIKAKLIGLTVTAVLGVTAFAASSASASGPFEASPTAWYIGSQPGAKLTGTKAFTASTAAPFAVETGFFGGHLTMKASAVECLGCVIQNSVQGTSTTAQLTGRLKFTGMTQEGINSNCLVAPIESKPLIGSFGKQAGVSQPALVLQPVEGETFWTFELYGAGCSLAGTYKMTGSIYGEMVNALGVDAKTQQIRFSSAIQETLGSGAFRFGANHANLNGTIAMNLTSEQEFQLKTK